MLKEQPLRLGRKYSCMVTSPLETLMATRRPATNAQLLSAQDPSSSSSSLSPSQPYDHDEGLGETLSALVGGACEPASWIVAGCADTHFQVNSWLDAMLQLIHYPERTSSSILRADILHDEETDSSRSIKRKLLPRRPNLDKSIEQVCSIYAAKGLVVMKPLLSHEQASNEIPYYHPCVRSLAFVYAAAMSKIFVYVLPFANDTSFDAAKQPQHRLSRTILMLLELQCKIAWGNENGYVKRGNHDVVLKRDAYQALYMRLRQTYARTLCEKWVESTDARKHVFEDIGIAAFIMLLWREMFSSTPSKDDEQWGRPKCFVDLGCGNGLLVYLLNAEGYTGYGIDVQERKSWQVFRALHNSVDIRLGTLNVPQICNKEAQVLPEEAFLIGNHADELTAWLPLLAHCTTRCPGFINIPCCRFALDGSAFGHSKYALNEQDVCELIGGRQEPLLSRTMQQIQRGPAVANVASTTSRNVAFLRYLSHVHLQAGWQLEKEALRIPSTKNWSLIGRRRIWQDINDDGQASIEAGVRTETQQRTTERVRRLVDQAGAHWNARVAPNSNNDKAETHTH